MCRSPLHSFIARLPKVELHLHLEGTLSPSLLFSLAARNSITLPSSDPAFASPAALQERYERFTSLSDFLDYYYIGMSVLVTTQDYEELAYEYFKRAVADGCVHAEVFFDPQAHTSRGVPYATVVEGFSAGQRRAEKDFGITSKLVLCFLRNLPVEDAKSHFQVAESLGHFSDGTVAGVGLDSAEVGYPPELFREIFELAAKAGARRTAHAGEEGDPSYISGALDSLGVERIDHGIRLAEDDALMRRVVAEKKLLTMCPISNVQLRCVKKVADLPIRKFLDAGVRICFNSDDPAYFGGYLLDNYCAVQDAFDLSVAEWKGVAEGAVEGCWAEEERKKEIMGMIGKVVEECS